MNSSYEAPPIIASLSHDVMFQIPLEENGPPKPFPSKYTEVCVDSVVKMPNSPMSIHEESNTKMWDVVCKNFKEPLKTFEDLRKAILSYNNYNEKDGNFAGLKMFLEKQVSQEEQIEFFNVLLPKIISLALSLPEEVTRPVPLLMMHSTKSISLSQKQIGVLLANAFLCTFPSRSVSGEKCGYGDYPDINFNRLFLRKDKHTEHKFRCIFNYFKRITMTEPEGVVTYTRQFFSKERGMPLFESSSQPLPPLNLEINGVIEKATDHLQVDFADKYVGGMIFTKGCLQEEIRFLLCPELILSRLFTAVLDETEALIVTGVEQYNDERGYGRSFQFLSSFQDETPRDEYRRRRCQIIAINALNFSRRTAEQYKEKFMLREMQKAYAGFCPIEGTNGPLTPVATGNWGCGVFRGNPKLKGLLQLIAAGLAGRGLTYFAFGRKDLVSELGNLYKYLTGNDVTVGELATILFSYSKGKEKVNGKDLYDYIRQNVNEN